MKNSILMSLVLAVVVGAIGFYTGMKYQQSKAPSFASRGGNFTGRLGQGQNGANRPVSGDILSVDANSITVKLADGSSKIVLLTGSTVINKAATGSKDDLKVGTRVGAFGVTNSDGSVTATNIQINPSNGRMEATPTAVQK